jgi:O-antigen/teichoic acid export membrane protein
MTPYTVQVLMLGLSAIVVMQADNLIIGLFLPVAAVTLYAAAFRFFQVAREISGSVMLPLISEASRAHAGGESGRLQALCLRGTKYANVLVLGLCIPGAILAEPILALWAGDEFRSAADVAQILLLSLVVANNHLVAMPVLMGMGRIRDYARLHVTWAAANIVLSVILVQSLELTGIALATAIPIVLLEPLYVWIAAREVGFSLRAFIQQSIARPAAAAAVPAVALLLTAVAMDPEGALEVGGLTLAYLAIFGATAWFVALDAGERAKAVSRVSGSGPASAVPAGVGKP